MRTVRFSYSKYLVIFRLCAVLFMLLPCSVLLLLLLLLFRFLGRQGADGLDAAKAVSSGVNLCRDLVNSPPNVLTPVSLAEAAVKIAEDHGLEAEILEVSCGEQRFAIRMRGEGRNIASYGSYHPFPPLPP